MLVTSLLEYNIIHVYHNIKNVKNNNILWTTFKSEKKKLSGKGYTKAFIPCNERATNDYKDKTCLAYCCNRYISPDYVNYLIERGAKINEDLYALSEMLQWVWRSAIREGNPIDIYIPSARMRNLLLKWLNNEIEISEK